MGFYIYFMVLAMVISYSQNKSIMWAIIHSICSFVYMLYYILFYSNDEIREYILSKMSDRHEDYEKSAVSEYLNSRINWAKEQLRKEKEQEKGESHD